MTLVGQFVEHLRGGGLHGRVGDREEGEAKEARAAGLQEGSRAAGAGEEVEGRLIRGG